LTDSEFASKIYCEVFSVANDDGDAYVRGILETIGTLKVNEQKALEYYYRDGNTYIRTAELLGVNRSTGRHILATAVRKMRHVSRKRKMSVKLLLYDRDRAIDDANAKIEVLSAGVKQLAVDTPDNLLLKQEEFALCLTDLGELGLSSYVHNLILKSNIRSVEALLKLNSLKVLLIQRGFGIISRNELISKMREHGHNEWATQMEAEWTKESGVSFSTFQHRMKMSSTKPRP